MSNNLKNDLSYRVSDKGGAMRLTTSGNVAVATALDTNVREIFMQATAGNASAIKMNIGAAASAALGIVLPTAITTVDNKAAGYIRMPIASVTAVQFYAAENGDSVDIVWRN